MIIPKVCISLQKSINLNIKYQIYILLPVNSVGVLAKTSDILGDSGVLLT